MTSEVTKILMEKLTGKFQLVKRAGLVSGNEKRDQCQYSRGRCGWSVEDGDIPPLGFGQLDESQSTTGRLPETDRMLLAAWGETHDW